MTILEFFRTTRANLWLLIIGIIVGAVAGFGYASLQPKVYAASSSGYVTVGESGTVDVLSGSSAAKERARSYAAIVSSEAVAQRIKQKNADLSNLSTGQIRASLSASAGENAALITVSAKASSPKTHSFWQTALCRLPQTTSMRLSRTPVMPRLWSTAIIMLPRLPLRMVTPSV